MVICLQIPTIFQTDGRTVIYSMYTMLTMLARHDYSLANTTWT